MRVSFNTDDFRLRITYNKSYNGKSVELKKVESQLLTLPESIENFVKPDQDYKKVYKEMLRDRLELMAKNLIQQFLDEEFD